MPIYRLGDLVPEIHPEAFVHPEAVVIGDVTIGPEATVWPQAVLRGDFGRIVIGARSSVQDGTVIHAGPGLPTLVGTGCVIGHLAHLEGCTLEDDSLVGSCSVVLHWAVVSTGATVGANAVVANRSVVPPGHWPSACRPRSGRTSRTCGSSRSRPRSTWPTGTATGRRSSAWTCPGRPGPARER